MQPVKTSHSLPCGPSFEGKQATTVHCPATIAVIICRRGEICRATFVPIQAAHSGAMQFGRSRHIGQDHFEHARD